MGIESELVVKVPFGDNEKRKTSEKYIIQSIPGQISHVGRMNLSLELPISLKF